jgi:predicted DNA-binding ribbon-helix-helix protein
MKPPSAGTPDEDRQGPIKRSVMIAGHATSISLEPLFWTALTGAATDEALPLSALVARIDADRIRHPRPANLASAIRVWLLRRALEGDINRQSPAESS